jgi:hypothetical protein
MLPPESANRQTAGMRGLSSLDWYWGLVGTGTKIAAGRAVVERVASVSENVKYGLFIPSEIGDGLIGGRRVLFDSLEQMPNEMLMRLVESGITRDIAGPSRGMPPPAGVGRHKFSPVIKLSALWAHCPGRKSVSTDPIAMTR